MIKIRKTILNKSSYSYIITLLYIIYNIDLYLLNVFYQSNIIPNFIFFNWKVVFLLFIFVMSAYYFKLFLNFKLKFSKIEIEIIILLSLFFIIDSYKSIFLDGISILFLSNILIFTTPFLISILVYKIVNINIVLKLNLYLACLVSLLALYQMLFDKTLFMAYEIYTYTSVWEFVRMTSTLGSPMMLGMYLGLTFATYIIFMNGSNLFIILILIIGGILSGSKIFGLILIISILNNIRSYFKVKNIMILFGFVIVIIFFSAIDDTISNTVKRALFLQDNLVSTESTNRVLIYTNVMEDIAENPLGHNISKYSMASRSTEKDSSEYATLESYQLTILYDNGVLGLIIINLIFVIIFLKSKREYKLFVFIFYLSTFPVHSLFFPYFYIFWSLLFYSINDLKEKYV